MKPASRRRGELQDRVVEELHRGLMIGAFVPGQKVSLRKLAESFGVSAMPVREAINQLVAANVLEMLPNRTVCVPRMSAARFDELSRARQAIEGMAAEMAGRRATPALVRRLHKVNAELVRGIRARDILACLNRNQEFHFTLYRAAESEVLMPLIEPLWLQAGPMMYYSLISLDIPWNASAHGEVLSALRGGDAAGVRRAIEQDIRLTDAYLLKSSFFLRTAGPLARLSGDALLSA
ncbi:MAG: GntR family transcriptional regulator [Burkholderiales bacterium]|nr:GntR family transcriptional regulator [Burkholderiales bacterium]